MKNTWVIVAVVLVVLVGGYLGRHKIKAMFAGSSSAPAPAQTQTMTPMPSASASSSAMMEGVVMTKSSSKGDYLTDSNGMTLYMFDKDTKGVSNCNGGCIKAWPPYLQASASASTLPSNVTVIKRTDGTMQYAYSGMPVYHYASDTKVGDMTGDGIGGVWHLVKP